MIPSEDFIISCEECKQFARSKSHENTTHVALMGGKGPPFGANPGFTLDKS